MLPLFNFTTCNDYNRIVLQRRSNSHSHRQQHMLCCVETGDCIASIVRQQPAMDVISSRVQSMQQKSFVSYTSSGKTAYLAVSIAAQQHDCLPLNMRSIDRSLARSFICCVARLCEMLLLLVLLLHGFDHKFVLSDYRLDHVVVLLFCCSGTNIFLLLCLLGAI